MNKTVLALATALVLAGGTANPAFAKHGNGHGNGHDDRAMHQNDYRHGKKHKANGVRSPNHWDRSVVHDSDRDGIPNSVDNRDNRWDRARFRYSTRHVYTALNPYTAPAYVAPAGYRYSRYNVGAMLPSGYYGDPYYIDYQPYSLPPPPVGYRWTRVGNDVYLVQTRNGMIADIVYSLFH